MKIDANDKIQPVAGQSGQAPRKTQAPNGFDDVLKDTIMKSGGVPVESDTTVRQILGPSTDLGILPNYHVSASVVADEMIDLLENYQQMLSDPLTSLKVIQPVIDEMKKQAAGTESVITGLPNDDPVKMIMQEAAGFMAEEVNRFYSGYYIDD